MGDPAPDQATDDLVHLAVMVEASLHFGDGNRARSLGERLLEQLSRHYRAMRPLRLRCEPTVGAALADEAFNLIDDLQQLVAGNDHHGSLVALRNRVERLMEHEAAVVMMLGSSGTLP
jgi:hypothetical protein